MSSKGRGIRVGGAENTVWLPKLAVPASFRARLDAAMEIAGMDSADLRRHCLDQHLRKIEAENEEGARGNTTRAPSVPDDLSGEPTQPISSRDG